MKKFSLPTGMRTIKTVLCVFICLALYELFAFFDRHWASETGFAMFIKYTILKSSPTFACIAAVISMQNTVEKSYKFGISRIIGSIIGGIFGLVFLSLDSLTFHYKFSLLYCVLGVFLIICFCSAIRQPLDTSIAMITFLIIMVGIDVSHPYLFALNRIVGSIIGVCISLLINLNIKKPVRRKKSDQR